MKFLDKVSSIEQDRIKKSKIFYWALWIGFLTSLWLVYSSLHHYGELNEINLDEHLKIIDKLRHDINSTMMDGRYEEVNTLISWAWVKIILPPWMNLETSERSLKNLNDHLNNPCISDSQREKILLHIDLIKLDNKRLSMRDKLAELTWKWDQYTERHIVRTSTDEDYLWKLWDSDLEYNPKFSWIWYKMGEQKMTLLTPIQMEDDCKLCHNYYWLDNAYLKFEEMHHDPLDHNIINNIYTKWIIWSLWILLCFVLWSSFRKNENDHIDHEAKIKMDLFELSIYSYIASISKIDIFSFTEKISSILAHLKTWNELWLNFSDIGLCLWFFSSNQNEIVLWNIDENNNQIVVPIDVKGEKLGFFCINNVHDKKDHYLRFAKLIALKISEICENEIKSESIKLSKAREEVYQERNNEIMANLIAVIESLWPERTVKYVDFKEAKKLLSAEDLQFYINNWLIEIFKTVWLPIIDKANYAMCNQLERSMSEISWAPLFSLKFMTWKSIIDGAKRMHERVLKWPYW